MLDILHIWSNRRKGKASLKQILEDRGKIIERPPVLRDKSEERPSVPLLQGSDYVKKLKELFLADGAFLYLTDFTIREFEGKNAFIVNDMVATQYPRFCNWIKEMKD